MNQMRSWSGARRSIICSSRSMLLWRISSTSTPCTRSWLAAIWTLAWTWWSSSDRVAASRRAPAAWTGGRATSSAPPAREPPNISSSSASSSMYGGDRQVRARGGELRAVAHHGVDDALAQARVHLQPQIAARAEVDDLGAVQRERAPVQRLVVGRPQEQALRRSLGHHVVKDGQALLGCPHVAPPVRRKSVHQSPRHRSAGL